MMDEVAKSQGNNQSVLDSLKKENNVLQEEIKSLKLLNQKFINALRHEQMMAKNQKESFEKEIEANEDIREDLQVELDEVRDHAQIVMGMMKAATVENDRLIKENDNVQ